MAGVLKVLPDPVPAVTVSRFVWIWLEQKAPQLGYPYPTEEDARRLGKPPGKKAVLLELVLPREEILAAIQAAPTD